MNIWSKTQSWIGQPGTACILLIAGLGILQDTPDDFKLFTDLGMEPKGRVIIGICELSSAIGLLHPLSAAYTVLLGTGVLTRAGLAHLDPFDTQALAVYLPNYDGIILCDDRSLERITLFYNSL